MFLGLLDPDPDPYGFISSSGSGFFYHETKIVRKTLILNCFVTSVDFLFLKNDVNVRYLQINKQKNFFLIGWRLEGQ
jgi:hypothetical protein